MDPIPTPSPNPNPLFEPQPPQPVFTASQPSNNSNTQPVRLADGREAASQTNPVTMSFSQSADTLGGSSNIASQTILPDQTSSPTDNVLVGHIPQTQMADLIQPTPQPIPSANNSAASAISQPVKPSQIIPNPQLNNQPAYFSPAATSVAVNSSQLNSTPLPPAPPHPDPSHELSAKSKPTKDFKSNLAMAGLIVGVLTVLVEVLITSSTLKQIIYIIPLSLTAIGLSAPALGSSRRGYAIGGLVLGSLSLASIIILYGVSFAVDNRCQSDPNFASSNAQCRPNQPNNPGL